MIPLSDKDPTDSEPEYYDLDNIIRVAAITTGIDSDDNSELERKSRKSKKKKKRDDHSSVIQKLARVGKNTNQEASPNRLMSQVKINYSDDRPLPGGMAGSLSVALTAQRKEEKEEEWHRKCGKRGKENKFRSPSRSSPRRPALATVNQPTQGQSTNATGGGVTPIQTTSTGGAGGALSQTSPSPPKGTGGGGGGTPPTNPPGQQTHLEAAVDHL